MAEKTEKATPKKLRDARKKGQVAKSQDLPSVFTFITSVWVILGMSYWLYTKLGDYLTSVFHLIPNPDLQNMIVPVFRESANVVFVTSMPALMLVASVGVLVTFLTVGPVFSLEMFKFDIKKFDPVQNLKAKFKLKILVELGKSMLKITVASWIVYDVMYHSLPTLTETVSLPITSALVVLNVFLMEVLIKVGLFFLVIAVLDFAYQKYNFANEMKMEKFEVKQEYKNTEGDPHIKSKRRQIGQEIAYSDSPMQMIKRSKALITNPTHLVVGIAYDKHDAAPYILVKAQDEWAKRAIKIAKDYNIPVVRNINLAHKLWDEGNLYEFIPEDTYAVVAEIIKWINALNTSEAYDYEPTEK